MSATVGKATSGPWRRELRHFFRSGGVLAAPFLLFVLAAVSVWAGLTEVERQKSLIEDVRTAQVSEEQAVTRYASDPGDAAYYTFHVVWSDPSPLAFAAMGQRDIAPYVMRIRALALEGQIHDSETSNPVLSLIGSFDFLFVLIYLAPLVIIVLMHDLMSAEHAAGRLVLLRTTPHAWRRLWLPRIGIRLLLVFLALALPLASGLFISEAGMRDALLTMALVAGLVTFWGVLSTLIAVRPWGAAAHAAVLAATWFALTIVVPAATSHVVNAAVPLTSGAQIIRDNREAVHDGWDLDRADTMTRFFSHYPQWANTAPVTTPFHWKWYFAFQHLGDLHVAKDSLRYRDGIAAREELASRLAWVSPPVVIQRALISLAKTDGLAHLRFQESIRDYHDDLRAFYYSYIFADRQMLPEDFEKAPRFVPTS